MKEGDASGPKSRAAAQIRDIEEMLYKRVKIKPRVKRKLTECEKVVAAEEFDNMSAKEITLATAGMLEHETIATKSPFYDCRLFQSSARLQRRRPSPPTGTLRASRIGWTCTRGRSTTCWRTLATSGGSSAATTPLSPAKSSPQTHP